MEEQKAALFDLDGTLVRTFIDFDAMRSALRALAASHGAAAAVAGEDDVLEIVAKTVRALGQPAGKAAQREAYALLAAIEEEGCALALPIAGASNLLRRLRNNDVPVGVITRNCRHVALDLARRFDLEHDVLVAREDTPQFKPHPAPVLAACRALNVSPADAVLVGDLWADIAAGRAAGVARTIGIQWPHDPPNRFAGCPPDVIVDSLAAASALLIW